MTICLLSIISELKGMLNYTFVMLTLPNTIYYSKRTRKIFYRLQARLDHNSKFS
jgi:hypothetical protein